MHFLWFFNASPKVFLYSNDFFYVFTKFFYASPTCFLCVSEVVSMIFPWFSNASRSIIHYIAYSSLYVLRFSMDQMGFPIVSRRILHMFLSFFYFWLSNIFRWLPMTSPMCFFSRFSYMFPLVFLNMSNVILMCFPYMHLYVFPYGFPMFFLCFSYAILIIAICFLMPFLKFLVWCVLLIYLFSKLCFLRCFL